MKYAIRMGDFITNIIIANEGQKEELETALSATLINTAECAVQIGDYWNGENWTRNVDGEQVVVDTTPVVETPIEDRVSALEATTAEMAEAIKEGVNDV